MVLRKIVGIAVITLLVGAASLASATTPDLNLSTSARADASDAVALVYNLPDGTGSPFNEAQSFDTFGAIDATISVTLLNSSGLPVPNFPAEDLYLVNDDGGEFGGMMPCGGFATADANSDDNGMAWWADPLTAGGYSNALTVIMVSGAPLESSAGEKVSFNSPDFNGDLIIDLLDVIVFSQNWQPDYSFRFDVVFDGVLDLVDVIRLAQDLRIVAPCPAR